MPPKPPTLTKAQRAFLLTVGGLTPAHLTPGTKEYEATLQAYRAAGATPGKPLTIKKAREIQRKVAPPKTPVIDRMLGDIAPDATVLTLSATERAALQARQDQATCEADRMACEPTIFKATLKDGGHVYVEAPQGDKSAAEQKATAAGYDVRRITWSPTYGEPVKTRTTPVSQTTIKVKDGATGKTLEFPLEGWDAWPSKYQNLVKKEGYDAAMREFSKEYYQLADGQWLLKDEFYSLPTNYADIAATKGMAAMQTAFEADHVQLKDGQWIAKDDWDAVGEGLQGIWFQKIGKHKGLDAMVSAIDKANEPYEKFQDKLKHGEIIAVGDGQYITRAEYEKLPTGSQEILRDRGFTALADETTLKWEKGPEPKVFFGQAQQQARLDRWKELPQTITNAEMREIPFVDKDFYSIAEGSRARAGLLALSSFLPPAKAALPEYTMQDVTAMDWGIAAAQVPLIVVGLAPGALSGSVAAKAATVAGSSALGGMIGYGTAKNWASLTPGQRAMGVSMTALCAIPFITTVGRHIKVSGPVIPTTGGKAVAWKGLSVAGHPIIGRSGGKWVLGTRSITLPEARLILNGYKPETMLETKVFVNTKALSKAGFSQAQIKYLTTTLRSRNLFAGKQSPWLNKNVLTEPTARLNSAEIDTIIQHLNKLEQAKTGNLKQAFLHYGSPTIKAQLAPKLRGWRPIHDWDISLNMNQAQTQAWTRALLQELRKRGAGTYRIPAKSPTLIEKKIGGKWQHIADIHAQPESIVGSAMDIPASKLDHTGTYSYGRMVAEPAITVKYPGVGKLHVMRLSESGVRKADTILRVRQTKLLTPMDRYVATGGYSYGQDLVNSLSATYGIKAIPVEKLSFWARLHKPGAKSFVAGRIRAPYVNETFVNMAKAQIELAPTLQNQGHIFSRVALHELAHGHLFSKGALFNAKGLRAFANTSAYKTAFKFIGGLKNPIKAFRAASIGDEFMCIKLTAKMSGWHQTEYITMMAKELRKMGATRAQVGAMLKLSQQYVNTVKVPHKVPIDRAFNNFLTKTTPEYASIFKQVTEFQPPPRGIAEPGVPKDAADFYVTLRTLQGKEQAETWLKSWANAMGYTDDWLATAMKKARPGTVPQGQTWDSWVKTTLADEMVNVASNSPSSIIGYEFKPSGTTRVSAGASPSIVVHVPSSLGASVSPKLERQISRSIFPYKLVKSPEIQAAISAGVSGLLSKASPGMLKSPSLSPSVARSLASASPKASPSPSVSAKPSPSAKPSVSLIPNVSPSSKVSPSFRPSPSTKPSPTSKPSPSPSPSPRPEPKPRQAPGMGRAPKRKQRRIRSGPALAVWRQGAYWVSIFPPFRTTGLKEDVIYSKKRPKHATVLARGPYSPKITLKSFGKVPELVTVPMGVVTARIRRGKHLTFHRRNGKRRGRIIY